MKVWFFSGVFGPLHCSNFQWCFIYPMDTSGLCVSSGTKLAMITGCLKGSSSELQLKQRKTQSTLVHTLSWENFSSVLLQNLFLFLRFYCLMSSSADYTISTVEKPA